MSNCISCGGSNNTNKGKWNNLPREKTVLATPTVTDSRSADDIIKYLPEPFLIENFAKESEGDLWGYAIEALVGLDAREQLINLMPEDTIVPSALSSADIGASLLGDIVIDEVVENIDVVSEEKENIVLQDSKTENDVINAFNSDLEAMIVFAKSIPSIKLGRANKLNSVAKKILTYVQSN